MTDTMNTDQIRNIVEGALMVARRPLNVDGFPPRHTEIFAIRRRDKPMGKVMTAIWAAIEDRADEVHGLL